MTVGSGCGSGWLRSSLLIRRCFDDFSGSAARCPQHFQERWGGGGRDSHGLKP